MWGICIYRLQMAGHFTGSPAGATTAREASRSEATALSVNDQPHQSHPAAQLTDASACPTPICSDEGEIPASPTTAELGESNVMELEIGPALESLNLGELSPTAALLHEQVKRLELRAFASEQERQRLFVGVWRGVMGHAAADSDEDVIDAVWQLARQRDTNRDTNQDDVSHFPCEDAKKDVARFLVGLVQTLPPRSVRLAGMGSVVGPEPELVLSRARTPMFDEEDRDMYPRARFT